MKIKNLFCIFLFFIFFCSPLNLYAAEVLQVRSSSLLQIGDRNRSYTVKLACVEVEKTDEIAAINYLRSKLRKNEKVNLMPKGTNNGILLAKIIPLRSKIDLAQSLYQAGLAGLKC
ncbi:nuclease [Prochlorococcus sp. MIT 1307]|uniref:nuclease n=1 Tax=Prochlorococcus sp. MIT 1307 TaxID=3096219 RepID=UPI002A764204|nr:nuclease [Prochlorococcus sp. MIT 1307]